MSFILNGKSVAVIGMARTGLAVAEVVIARGGHVSLFDAKPADQLSQIIDSAAELGAQTYAGCPDPDLTGFDLVVTSPGVPSGKMGLEKAQASGVEVIAEIELAYRIAQAPVIAITGTNGKTTTTVLTGLMLRESGFDTYIAGNAAGTGLVQDDRTIMPLVRAAHKAGPEDRIVAEISSFQLERISSFKPFIAAVLNITSDHMDRYKTVQDYADAKARMFEFQDSGCWSIVNADDVGSYSLLNRTRGKVLEFSRNRDVAEGAYVRSEDIVLTLHRMENVVCARSEMKLRGEHNVENVLASSLMAVLAGAKPEDCCKVIKDFGGVAHRMESVRVLDGVEYINNSMCTNVDAAIKSIESVDSPVIVICGGRDKNLDYTQLAQSFVEKAKHVVLIGEAADTLREYAQKAGYSSITRAGSMSDAVESARSVASEGDVVLLAPVCSSFDMFSSFEERGEVFKKVVMDLRSAG